MALKNKLTRQQYEKKIAEILATIDKHTKPFEDDSDQAKKERRERGKKDIEYFKRTYFPHYFFAESGEMHRELNKKCYLGKGVMVATHCAREHGKSVNTTFLYPIHKAVYELSKFTILISDSLDLAEEFLAWIKLEFEENPRLRQDFGNLVTAGFWESNEIVVGGKCMILALGSGGKIRGRRFRFYRPQFIIIDDLENDINVKNKKIVKEKFDWILGAVFGSLDKKKGVLCMVGTMLARVCVLSLMKRHIEETGPKFEKKFGEQKMFFLHFPAIKKDGTPSWPERYTIRELEEIKEMVGTLVWSKDFQGKPIEKGLFQEKWITSYQREVVLLIPREWGYFSGSDPSARQNETSDYKAHVVNAKDMETKYQYCVEAWIKKEKSKAEFIQAYIDLWLEYRMNASGFEVNGYQLYIMEDLLEACQQYDFMPNIIPITHTSDKVMRIAARSTGVEKSRYQFDRNHSDQELLVEQLLYLGTGEHDDGPDAWEMAIDVSENWGGQFEYRSSGARGIIQTIRQVFTGASGGGFGGGRLGRRPTAGLRRGFGGY